MERGLYIAAAGMLAEQVRQDQISSNLANSSTAGYKADRSTQKSFGEHLLTNTRTGQSIGELGDGPRLETQQVDLRQASLKDTEEPTDLAISGEGFFAIRAADGVRYTRNGQFSAAKDGTLVDQLGNKVLGKDGRSPVKVNADGTVDTAKVGLFGLTAVKKQGDNFYTGKASADPAGQVQAGKLEASGVDATRAMVDMMASLRAYEASQRAISTIDTSLGQAAGQVGNLG